jgi:hypothetical protein
MPIVLGITGALQRSDTAMTRDEEQLSSNITVADDSMDSMEIPTLGTQVVGFGSISEASFVLMKSDKFLNITLTVAGPVVLAPIRSKMLWLEDTKVTAVSLENPNDSVAFVRVFLGGA